MTQHFLRCSDENSSVLDKRANDVVKDDIAAVVVVGGGETPKEQEDFEETPEGDKVRVLWRIENTREDQVKGDTKWKDYKVPEKKY